MRRVVVGIVLAGCAAAQADVVTDWNSTWMQAIRINGGGPGPVARSGAMVHAAIYDAVNSITNSHQAYLIHVPTAATTSREAAAAQAAHDVLAHLYPAQAATFAAQLTASLTPIANNADKAAGIALGQSVAAAVIASRLNDGMNDDAMASYTAGTKPGDWRPTEGNPAFGSIWHQVTPWVINSHDQFRPPLPPALGSAEYTAAFNQVKEKGVLTGSTRTAEETAQAAFWANDLNGTYKPPGHLNAITQVISASRGLSMEENARLFALLNIALGDASIVAWDCKYATDVDFWRPVTAIQNANEDDPDTLANEDNPLTATDAAWVPLSNAVNGFTPPFPAYVSGHATFAATHAAILRNFLGTDVVNVTIDTDDPYYNNILMGGDLFYSTLTEMAFDNAQSRIFLGVHWQFDADFGISSGTDLGNYVFANILLVPEPGSLALLSVAAALAFGRKRRC